MAGRIDDEPNPRWDEWINKPLSKAEKERLMRELEGKGGGGGGGMSSSNYMTAMEVGLVAILLLGWRIAVELSRIRRAVRPTQRRGRYRRQP
jgi:hypothetical protein